VSDMRATIKKIDENLRDGYVQKSEPITKETAMQFLYKYADGEKEANPKISAEKAFAKALLDCPHLGSLVVLI